MESITTVENVGIVFCCTVLGCYAALFLRDRWRHRVRRKRLEKEGRYLGTPVTMVMIKSPLKDEDIKQ